MALGRSKAQPIVFTSNAAINADQRFEYDALYRLVHAEGREHGSQGQPTADDSSLARLPTTPRAWRAYTFTEPRGQERVAVVSYGS